MKKSHEYFASHQNTPHLDTNTKIIRWSYLFLGGNSILFAISDKANNSMLGGVILGVSFLLTAYLSSNDPRKKERGVLAAMLNLALWFALTIWGSIWSIAYLNAYALPVAGILELFILSFFLRRYKR